MAKSLKKGLTVKDLITAAIFSVILLLSNALGGGLLAANPALTFYYPIAGSVLGGPIFMLLVAKVPKRWILSIAGVVFCILGFVTGMHWGMNCGVLVAMFIADQVVSAGKSRNRLLNILGYVIYSIGPCGTYFVYFISPESWTATMLKNGTTQEYIDVMSQSAGAGVLIIMIVGTILVSALSGFIGTILLKKQFEKAGVTAE